MGEGTLRSESRNGQWRGQREERGQRNGDPPPAFYRYDPTTDRGSHSRRPQSTSAPVWAESSRKVLRGGRGDRHGYCRQLDVYDPVASQWTSKATMPRERLGAADVALAGKLYVIGAIVPNPDGSVASVRTTAV